jgi:RimJ/RimL family protein N-acetyltransferase
MNAPVEYLLNKACEAEIVGHIWRCNADFVPPLSTRVDIGNYAHKLATNATRFEAWWDGTLVGLVGAYCNDPITHIAYITHVSLLNAWTGKGIAGRLMNLCIAHAKDADMRQINLEVAQANTPAIHLYKKNGFTVRQPRGPFIGMNLCLSRGEEHEQQT